MIPMIRLTSARRSLPTKRSSRPLWRTAGPHETTLSYLHPIEGGEKDDLVATIIHAIDLANSCGSETTAHLLKMALLNEGIEIADDIRKKKALLAVQKSSASS